MWGGKPLAPSAPTPRLSHFQRRRAAGWVDHTTTTARGGHNNNGPFPISQRDGSGESDGQQLSLYGYDLP